MNRRISGEPSHLLLGIATFALLLAIQPSVLAIDATAILDASGVQGGLVLHVGCGDGALTAALRPNDRFVVHGLDADPQNVAKARAHVRSLGLYGPVSIDRLDGRELPLIDNTVSLLVSEGIDPVPMSEVMRVLRPSGVAYLQREGEWTRTVKPWPDQLDEWTHYLHDVRGTMVAQDDAVGPPQGMQWVGAPKWLRNHDFMSSLHGMVSAKGRVFYIVDEGLRNHIYLPAEWKVVGRDAFSGVVLWKRDLAQWFPHTWPFKSGPGHLPRRIVAVDDRVFVTLGLVDPISMLDAATGETIRTYPETRATEEVLYDGGVLYALVDPDKKPFVYSHASDDRNKERTRANTEFGWTREQPARQVMAVDAESGKVLWSRPYPVASLTLSISGTDVCFFDGERVVALDRQSGDERWKSESTGQSVAPETGYAPRIVVADGVIVVSTKGSQLKAGRLVGVSAETGEVLWRADQLKSSHFSPEDLYLINGLLWTVQTGKDQTGGTRFQALDPKSGEVREDFMAENLEVFFMHQRCYMGRATERFIMTAGTGTEFLDLESRQYDVHHWIRGACLYGLMPSNGLLYKTPDTCACYYQSKLPHLCALSATSSLPTAAPPTETRLEKGPAYVQAAALSRAATTSLGTAWPTYRHDNARSGSTPFSVGTALSQQWRAQIGTSLGAMTAKDGLLCVVDKDTHTVCALEIASGNKLWSFTAGARIDSPPTLQGGLTLFGCADGWVYCLRSEDGALAWRFLVAPGIRKLVSYDQVESVWPLHGSVLVRDNVAYCLAGRNAFLDGGLRLVRLDCATGAVLSETVLNNEDPRTGENIQTLIAGKGMPMANTDIFSCDDRYLYMGAQRFTFDGSRAELDLEVGKEKKQIGESRHLFCPTGFLDEEWFHRSYWIYGLNAGEGHGEYVGPMNTTASGRIMTFDEKNVYTFFAHNVGNNINPQTYYSVYSTKKNVSPEAQQTTDRAARRAVSGGDANGPRFIEGTTVSYDWGLDRPQLLATAMVLAGRHLFIAGPPDVANEEETRSFIFGKETEIGRQLAEQEKAWEGRMGALVWAIDADSGNKLGEFHIPAIPVWDGLIALDGRLFIALKDGSVVCLGS